MAGTPNVPEVAKKYGDKRTTYQRYFDLNSELKSIRSGPDSFAREVAENLLTRRALFTETEKDRDRNNRTILDNTAVLAHRDLTASLVENVISPARPWFALSVGKDDELEAGEAQTWLYRTNQRMYRVLDRSNFYRQMPNHFADVAAFGTAVTLIEPDLVTVVKYTTLSWGTYALGVDGDGNVNTITREDIYTVRQLVPRFCRLMDDGNYDTSNLSYTTRRDWELGGDAHQNKVGVLHVVTENPEYNPALPQSKYKRYKSCYLEINADGKAYEPGYDILLKEAGFDYFPALVSRWNVRDKEIYGVDCPAEQAIGDIKQLYKMTDDENHLIDLALDPPLIGPDQLQNEVIQKNPGGFTVDNSTNAQAGLRPLFEIKQNAEFLLKKEEEIKEIIKRAFFIDIILSANHLRQTVTGQITATEFQILKEEKFMAFGPVTQSFFQMLRHNIDILFVFMQEQGLIDPPPPEIAGQDLPPIFLSPFALALRLSELAPIERLLGIVAKILEAGYEPIVDKIDLDQLVDVVARILQVPPNIVRPDDVVAEVRTSRAKAQQAQVAAEAAPKMAGAARDLAEIPNNGENMLQDLLAKIASGNMAKSAPVAV